MERIAAVSYLALAVVVLIPDLANPRDATLRRLVFDPFSGGLDEALALAPAIIAAKPDDFRARHAYALTFERAADYQVAAAELSTALAEKDLLA